MLTREWLSAFVPIGVLRSANEWIPVGAGVLFHQPPVIWLITANHVVENAKGHEIAPLVSAKGGGVTPVRIQEAQREYCYSWHADETQDIAVTLMPVSAEWEIKAIDESLCMKRSDLIPSMPCYTVGCPYGVRGFDPQRTTPLVLDGIVSGVDTETGYIYTSVPTFPGNSGGPIIVRRDPFNPAGGAVIGRPILFLAGILLQARLVSSPSDPSAAVSMPPLHLGVGVSIEGALALIKSRSAQQDRETALAK